MKPRNRVGLAVSAALLLAGCELFKPTPPPNVSVVVNVTQTQNAGQDAKPLPAGVNCPTPTHINIGGPADIRVNETKQISITPFIGVGAPSPKVCDDAREVKWQASATCAVVGSPPYTPDLRGVSVGTCKVLALVDGVKSDELTVEVK